MTGNTFGNNLKDLRKSNRMTQNELANIMNVNAVTICHWEKGHQEPCLDDIKKLSKLFKVSSDFLLGV